MDTKKNRKKCGTGLGRGWEWGRRHRRRTGGGVSRINHLCESHAIISQESAWVEHYIQTRSAQIVAHGLNCYVIFKEGFRALLPVRLTHPLPTTLFLFKWVSEEIKSALPWRPTFRGTTVLTGFREYNLTAAISLFKCGSGKNTKWEVIFVVHAC